MIQFDDSSIRVATFAHIPGAIFGAVLAFCAREPAGSGQREKGPRVP
jgi:hypothetical protein